MPYLRRSIVLYLLVYSFFRYFEEYHKDPSNLGIAAVHAIRTMEVSRVQRAAHLFPKRRCHTSYAPASKYIDQFPKEKTAIVARFVRFVAGSFTAVLILASLMDPDLFVHFNITPQRNVLFYIGVFGRILAVSRGMIPDEHLVFEPEAMLREVIQHTITCQRTGRTLPLGASSPSVLDSFTRSRSTSSSRSCSAW